MTAQEHKINRRCPFAPTERCPSAPHMHRFHLLYGKIQLLAEACRMAMYFVEEALDYRHLKANVRNSMEIETIR